MDFFRDGTLLVTSTNDGTMSLYDTVSGLYAPKKQSLAQSPLTALFAYWHIEKNDIYFVGSMVLGW